MYFIHQHYPFRRPPDRGSKNQVPVAVVGGGPIGLALALALARRGIGVTVIEADDTVCQGSRAICISRRSLEILDGLGVLDRFLAKGLPWTAGRSFYRDKEVLRLEMPHDGEQKLPPMLNLQQCFAEQFLVDALAECANAEILWQTSFTGLTERNDGVTLHLQTPEGAYDLDAAYVVACDGARSPVRAALGLELSGTSYEGRYVIVDIALKSASPTERRAWFDPPSNPGATVLMHRQPDDIWRVDYQLRDDEDADEEVKPERVLPRVRSHLAFAGEPDEWQPVWISLYKAHALTLDKYRHGRILLAGDAAHLVPIFGVRGMNSGFQDTANLAWKLAYVLRGLAPDGLLDSYSAESVGAARENLRQAAKSTRFMTPPTRGHALLRTAALSLSVQHAFARPLINPRQSTAITYEDSALSSFPARSAEFAGGPGLGEVMPDPPARIAANGTWLDGHLSDLLHGDFVCLLFVGPDGGGSEHAGPLEAFAGGRIPLQAILVAAAPVRDTELVTAVDPAGRIAARFAAVPGSAYLIRPDRHIAARWRKLVPEELAAALTKAVGGTAA